MDVYTQYDLVDQYEMLCTCDDGNELVRMEAVESMEYVLERWLGTQLESPGCPRVSGSWYASKCHAGSQ
jgi:hypothetical protein